MSERPESPLIVRTAWLAEPSVWIWEIFDPASQQVIENCWAAGWAGYDGREAAERAGLARLGELRGGPGPKAASVPQCRLITVPRGRTALYQTLKRSFADNAIVEVILDRRVKERRAGAAAHEPVRRWGDRGRGSDIDAQLAAGRSAQGMQAFDADARAILFLCCSEHLVGCPTCENTYRIRWLPRTDPWLFSCPLCGFDLTGEIGGHTETCLYWASRRAGQTPQAAGVG